MLRSSVMARSIRGDWLRLSTIAIDRLSCASWTRPSSRARAGAGGLVAHGPALLGDAPADDPRRRRVRPDAAAAVRAEDARPRRARCRCARSRRALHCDSSNVTGLVDGLAAQGLVERREAEHDRRVRMLVVTERGAEVRDRLQEVMSEVPERWRRSARPISGRCATSCGARWGSPQAAATPAVTRVDRSGQQDDQTDDSDDESDDGDRTSVHEPSPGSIRTRRSAVPDVLAPCGADVSSRAPPPRPGTIGARRPRCARRCATPRCGRSRGSPRCGRAARCRRARRARGRRASRARG